MKKNKELLDLLEDWKFDWNNPNNIYKFGKRCKAILSAKEESFEITYVTFLSVRENKQELEYNLENALKKANKFIKNTSKKFF